MGAYSIPDDVTDAVITARDFCGDERAAAADAMEAAGLPVTPDSVGAALQAANRDWAEYQLCAGVTRPISGHEGRRINRDLK